MDYVLLYLFDLASALRGDFACGQRTLPVDPLVIGDFAVVER